MEEARRAQLVQAAVGVLAEHGYKYASMARIATAAGVSKGVISYHFDGKDELLREVVEQVSAQAQAEMRPKILAATGAVARIGAYIRANLAFLAEHRDALAALVEVIVRSPAPNPYAARHAQAVAELAQLIAAGQESGELTRSVDSTVLAVAIRGAIDALPGVLDADPELDVNRYGDQLADLFERAARTDG